MKAILLLLTEIQMLCESLIIQSVCLADPRLTAPCASPEGQITTFRPMRATRRDRTVGTSSKVVLNAPKGARARGDSLARVQRAQRSVVLCLLSAAMRHSTPTKSCHVPYM